MRPCLGNASRETYTGITTGNVVDDYMYTKHKSAIRSCEFGTGSSVAEGPSPQHVARGNDSGHTTCGWRYATSKRVNGAGYRFIHSLTNLPGSMLCERCLTTERAIAVGAREAELSGDEC